MCFIVILLAMSNFLFCSPLFVSVFCCLQAVAVWTCIRHLLVVYYCMGKVVLSRFCMLLPLI